MWNYRKQPKKFTTPKINKIDLEIKNLQNKIYSLEEQKFKLISKKKIQCVCNVHGAGCGKLCEVGKMTHIIETYDRYECGVGYDVSTIDGEYGFICPYCDHLNRVVKKEYYQFFLGKYFKDTIIKHRETF